MGEGGWKKCACALSAMSLIALASCSCDGAGDSDTDAAPTDAANDATVVMIDAGVAEAGFASDTTVRDATFLGGSPDAGMRSGSKLGVHVLRGCGDCVSRLLDACPAVVKLLAGEGNDCVAAYRARCPAGTVVLRVFVGQEVRYDASDDATAAADDFWMRMQAGLGDFDPSEVDWLEGPNELDNLGDWYHRFAEAEFFAAFWDRLADLMNGAGYHPLVGSIAVGNPALAAERPADDPDASDLNYFAPIAEVMRSKDYPIAWAYHAYTSTLSMDASGDEAYWSLRYRIIRQQAGLDGFPLILTEGGQDAPGGWIELGTDRDRYLDWLRWFDGEMRRDPDVVGVSLFQAGSLYDGRDLSDWRAFDVCPIADELASQIAGSRPAPPGG